MGRSAEREDRPQLVLVGGVGPGHDDRIEDADGPLHCLGESLELFGDSSRFGAADRTHTDFVPIKLGELRIGVPDFSGIVLDGEFDSVVDRPVPTLGHLHAGGKAQRRFSNDPKEERPEIRLDDREVVRLVLIPRDGQRRPPHRGRLAVVTWSTAVGRQSSLPPRRRLRRRAENPSDGCAQALERIVRAADPARRPAVQPGDQPWLAADHPSTYLRFELPPGAARGGCCRHPRRGRTKHGPS